MAASSAAPSSARIRAARSERRSPVSVSESRRDVRWNNVAPMLLSRRDIAFDTVALERPSALAAAVKERCSTTAANMAQASTTGRRMMDTIRFNVAYSRNAKHRYITFQKEQQGMAHEEEQRHKQENPHVGKEWGQ